MATPEQIASLPEDTRPELIVIAGGLAAEQAVQVTPIDIDLPIDDFIVALHGLVHEDQPDKAPQELADVKVSLEAVRLSLSKSQGELAVVLDELTRRFYENNTKMIRVNGYLRDRQ